MQVVSDEATKRRSIFFNAVYNGLEGYICIGALQPDTHSMKEEYFQWPAQENQMLDHIQRFVMTHNIYFCSTLLTDNKRDKEHCAPSNMAWADLDACSPKKLSEQPSLVVETSPNRFQALWKFDTPCDPYDAEDISRRIAYKYQGEGCDLSGWDLTQFLRVPYCYNHKYSGGAIAGPVIKIVEVNEIQYSLQELRDQLPQVESYLKSDIPFPDPSDLPPDADDILQKHRGRLQPIAYHLYATQPEKDWSSALWQLEMFCIEAGMSREEVFVIARESACNKYKRDDTSEVQLWKEVCRAYFKHEQNIALLTPADMEDLLTEEERERAKANRTFIEEYIEWASMIGDAAPQYHQAGAFIILCSLLAGPIKLPTSFGTVTPNLWFMILADTTLTRKTTAMDLAMDIVTEIDPDAMMATDGSIEGLFGALQFRPNRPSVFLRDEFSGLIEAMTKKDYYAGMAETLTKLYDGKYQKRILRRDIIEVRDPVLIVFAGGIRERILQLLQYEHVASGFLPRFVFITAESDLSRIRPLGPPTDVTEEGRNELIERLRIMWSHYTSPQTVTIKDKVIAAPPDWRASLTPEAWLLYNHLENKMMGAALKSRMPDLMTPMFDRMSKSGLKAAVLLAATRMEKEVVVTVDDLLKSFSYVEQWRMYAVQVIENIGRTTGERNIQVILRAIQRKVGVTRSEIMQQHHMDARGAEQVLMTLEQRGLISRTKSGRTERLYPTAIVNQ